MELLSNQYMKMLPHKDNTISLELRKISITQNGQVIKSLNGSTLITELMCVRNIYIERNCTTATGISLPGSILPLSLLS